MKTAYTLYLIVIATLITACTSDKPVKDGLAYIDVAKNSSTGTYKRKPPLPEGSIADGRVVSLDEHSLFFYDLSREYKRFGLDKPDLSAEVYVSPFYRISKTEGICHKHQCYKNLRGRIFL